MATIITRETFNTQFNLLSEDDRWNKFGTDNIEDAYRADAGHIRQWGFSTLDNLPTEEAQQRCLEISMQKIANNMLKIPDYKKSRDPSRAPSLPADVLEGCLLDCYYDAWTALEVLAKAHDEGFPEDDGHGISEDLAIRGAEHIIGSRFQRIRWHLSAYGNAKALRVAHRNVKQVMEDWLANYVEPDVVNPESSENTTKWMQNTLTTFEAIRAALFSPQNLRNKKSAAVVNLHKRMGRSK